MHAVGLILGGEFIFLAFILLLLGRWCDFVFSIFAVVMIVLIFYCIWNSRGGAAEWHLGYLTAAIIIYIPLIVSALVWSGFRGLYSINEKEKNKIKFLTEVYSSVSIVSASMALISAYVDIEYPEFPFGWMRIFFQLLPSGKMLKVIAYTFTITFIFLSIAMKVKIARLECAGKILKENGLKKARKVRLNKARKAAINLKGK